MLHTVYTGWGSEFLHLPEVLTVGVFEVTLFPQPGQDGPTLPLQTDQSAVLQHILHQSPLVHHALVHNLPAANSILRWANYTTAQQQYCCHIRHVGTACSYSVEIILKAFLLFCICIIQITHDGHTTALRHLCSVHPLRSLELADGSQKKSRRLMKVTHKREEFLNWWRHE